MRFSILSTALVALSGTVTAFLTADDIVDTITTLTTKSQSLIEPAGLLSLTNAAFLLIGSGPWADLLDGLDDLIDTTESQITNIQTVEKNPTKFAGEEAELITGSLQGLIKVLTELLDSISGQAGVSQVPIVGPIIGQLVTPVLESLSGVLDTLLQTIIDQLDDHLAQTVSLDLATLDETLAGASGGFLG